MLQTALTRLLGIDHPIIQAGMGADAGPDLAAAVSGAGALGTLGSVATPPDRVSLNIRRCRDLTARPFALNLVTFETAPFRDELVELALRERVSIVTLSFGDAAPYVGRFKDAGALVLVQVQDYAGAVGAIAGRADAVIVQGNEAGGHTGYRGTLSLAAQVIDIAGDTPVVVAGGVANGRGLAAALAMGAAGVVMGTRFKATFEFAGTQAQKDAIVQSDGGDTAADLLLDIPAPFTWPGNVIGRAMRNRFTAEWRGRDEELRALVASRPPAAFLQELASDPATALNWAGEASGLVDGVLPAAEVVRRTADTAAALLLRVSRMVSE
ncbi:MAG: NAD(P)H-dependent flavin oxidoreductase [Dehalococcoidia bacterium]